MRSKLRQKYAELTEDDLRYTAGEEEELITRLQNRLGKSPEEVRKILRGLKIDQV